jgi:hypothetical protein
VPEGDWFFKTKLLTCFNKIHGELKGVIAVAGFLFLTQGNLPRNLKSRET